MPAGAYAHCSTFWQYLLTSAGGERVSAFALPDGRLNSVLVDYLSQNNLSELLSLAETLAQQKQPKD